MADVWGRGSHEMRSSNQEYSPEKCRERRRRRIEMRRYAVAAAAAAAGGSSSSSSSSSSSHRNNVGVQDDSTQDMETNDVVQAADDLLPPVVGVMSVAGRLRDMEDAITVRINLCSPEINRCQPVHFFGVFDGHGGPHVAALCREWMHVIFKEEVMRVASISGASNFNQPPERGRRGQRKQIEDTWRRVLKNCFLRLDALAMGDSYSYECPEEKCSCHPNEVAFSGSTAVVVILTQDYIIVANCGDSRAVLCREGRSIALSIDHKPDRAEERARIEASGGKVIFIDGPRVEGILAMSRAIGDKYLKPLVTPEPEIFFKKRDGEDECLILASDGLWDVLSNTMAGQVARECLTEEEKPAAGENNARRWRSAEWTDPHFPTRSASAAGLLTRLALGRRSYDNISVIVVDLKRNQIA